MKWSISTKILIPMGVVFVAFFLAQYYLLNASTQNILLEKAKNRALDMADAVIMALEVDLSDENFERIATSMASSDEVDFVMFVDKEAESIIASSRPEYQIAIVDLPSDVRLRVQYALHTTKWQFLDMGNNDFWFSYNIRLVPFSEDDDIYPYLMLTKWSGQSVNAAIAETQQLHFLYLSVGLIGMAILGYFLFLHVTLRPLNKLIRSINRKKPGELYSGLPRGSMDEFDVLSDSLLQMSKIEQESLENITQSKKRAEDMSELKSAFLANMSHEIRTPINGILGLVQVAQQSQNQEQIQQYLQKIFLSGQTLVGIINDILDFSKLAAGKVAIETIEFCPDQLVEQVIELCRNNAVEKDLKLVTRLAPDLPLTLSSDPLRLHQILLNLVNNAVKFTGKGVVSINMATEYRDDRLWLLVKVIDTGIGIPLDKQAHLFEEFVQADGSTTRKYGGTGLGLTISKNLVHLMGGEIGVHSEMGKGSSFFFHIPVQPSEHLKLQKKLQEVLEQIRIHYELLDGFGLSSPMISLVKRLDAFSKGKKKVRLCTMPQYLADEHTEHEFTVIMGVDEATLEGKQLPENVQPLYSKVNRESLINLLHKVLIEIPRLSVEPLPSSPSSKRNNVDQPIRVLLVEDNEINAEVILGMLDKRLYNVTHVENGLLSLEFLQQHEVDVVLMDVQMPVMDGYRASLAIREDLGLKVSIVGLSANALPEEVERAKAHGMDDYLAKPVMREALIEKLQYWGNVQPPGVPQKTSVDDELLWANVSGSSRQIK